MEIKFQFTPTKEDYIKGFQAVHSPSPRSIVLTTVIAIGIAALYGNQVVSRPGLNGQTAWFVPFAILFVILLITVLIFFLSTIFFSIAIDAKLRSDKEALSPVTWHMDDTQIITTTETGEIKPDWEQYSRAVEFGSYYMLFGSKNQRSCSVIPKRAFDSEQQEKDFRALIEQKLGQIKDEYFERRTLPVRLQLGGITLLAIVVVGYWVALIAGIYL